MARAGEAWRLGPRRLVCGEGDAASLGVVDAAISRWQAAAGDDARLETGETFAEAARYGRQFRF